MSQAPPPPSRQADDVSNPRDQKLAGLLAELTDQVRQAQPVDIEQVARQHPDVGEELRNLWGAVLLADAVGSQAGELTVPPAEEAGAATLQVPCQWGDYELLEELGRGGMGVVYKARQISLDREVAVKMILADQWASPADRTRLQREAEAVARLDHPGIVPVYEIGQQNGRPFFSMKYVPGQTLAGLLAEGPLAPREAARLLAAISRAIDYAHRRGVLHRDLKPSNILIGPDGGPHVTDFGLAKQIEGGASLTHSGAILGTPSYMAPEQAAGSRGGPSPASDVYSLGAILYAMLTGRPPFQAASPVDCVLMVLEQDPVPPRVVNPGADRDLEMIALKALQKPADLRYGSAAELAADLEAYLSDEPISARSGQFGQVVARLFRETHHATVLENWGLLWMWHSLVLLILCSLTNWIYLWQQAAGRSARWPYLLLWIAGAWAWAWVFWALRLRIGPVTFVERQIAHVWAASMVGMALLFWVEYLLDMPALSLSPVLGLLTGMVFMVKAGILSGSFYIQAGALFATALVMAAWPNYAHFIFGVVSAGCFFFPGLKYYRQRMQNV